MRGPFKVSIFSISCHTWDHNAQAQFIQGSQGWGIYERSLSSSALSAGCAAMHWTSREKGRVLASLCVLGLALALYANSLAGDFVFDDHSAIRINPDVRWAVRSQWSYTRVGVSRKLVCIHPWYEFQIQHSIELGVRKWLLGAATVGCRIAQILSPTDCTQLPTQPPPPRAVGTRVSCRQHCSTCPCLCALLLGLPEPWGTLSSQSDCQPPVCFPSNPHWGSKQPEWLNFILTPAKPPCQHELY